MSRRAEDKTPGPDDRRSDRSRPNDPKVTFQRDGASTRAEEETRHPRVEERAGFTDLTVSPDRKIEESKQLTALNKQIMFRPDAQRYTDVTEQREALVQVNMPTDDSTDERLEISNNAVFKDERQARSKESGKKFAKLRSLLTSDQPSRTEPAQSTNQSDSELSPKKEFIHQMERILESNTLSPKSTRLLQDALKNFKADAKYPTIDTAIERREKSPTDASPLHKLQKNEVPSTSAKNNEASRVEPDVSKIQNKRKEPHSKTQQAPKKQFEPELSHIQRKEISSEAGTSTSETESSAPPSTKSKDLPKKEFTSNKLTQVSTPSVSKLPDHNAGSIKPSDPTKSKPSIRKSIKFNPSEHKTETVDPTPGTSKSIEQNMTSKLPSQSRGLQSSLKKSVRPSTSSKHHLHFTDSTHSQTDPISKNASSKISVQPSWASSTFSDSIYSELNKPTSTATIKDLDFETRSPRITVAEAERAETDMQDKMKTDQKKFLDDECTLISFEIESPFSDFDLQGLTDKARGIRMNDEMSNPPVRSKPRREAKSSKKNEPGTKERDKNVIEKVRPDLNAKNQSVDRGTDTETDRINLTLFQGLEAPESEKEHRVDGNRTEKTGGDISGLRSQTEQAEESIESTADASAVQITGDAYVTYAPYASPGTSGGNKRTNLTDVGQTTFEIINPCACDCARIRDQQVVQNNPSLFRRYLNYFLPTFVDGSDSCQSTLKIILDDHLNALPAITSF